tara:strand:+ start:180 stop:614 length:435 start_codon:yes stop_codon:yes gene_type:complete
MSRVYDYIRENPGVSVPEIVLGIGSITEDKVRYQIKSAGDLLTKDDGYPAKFSVNRKASDEEANIEELEEAIKADRPKRKILTSQPQLNKMVATAKEAGVKMEYDKTERLWRFSQKGVSKQLLASNELPKVREAGFDKWLKENF